MHNVDLVAQHIISLLDYQDHGTMQVFDNGCPSYLHWQSYLCKSFETIQCHVHACKTANAMQVFSLLSSKTKFRNADETSYCLFAVDSYSAICNI